MRDPLVSNRVRKINGSFAFIEHRFLRHGFWASLGHEELLLYFFLVLVADRDGLSFYPYDKICSQLTIDVDSYILARDNLINKDLQALRHFLPGSFSANGSGSYQAPSAECSGYETGRPGDHTSNYS